MARSIRPKTRFDVFKRDGFSCQYCGKTPPSVVLEVDHIVSVSTGGTDVIDNLLTACFDCNRGKGAIGLDMVPKSVLEQTVVIREREKQLVEYKKAIKARDRRITSEIQQIAYIHGNQFVPTHWCALSDSFKNETIRMFLEKLPFFEVEKAMTVACSRISEPLPAVKYFCGICWKKIKGGIDG